MTGRSCDTKVDMIEKSIRTKAWFEFILSKSSKENAHQLASIFSEGERKWSNYAKGLNKPNSDTLNRAEALFVSSSSVFFNGPRYDLFQCMFLDLDSSGFFKNITCGPPYNENYIWLTIALDELPPSELIIHFENIAINNKYFNHELKTTLPDSPLNLLGGCFIVFRSAINKNSRFSDRNIHDLVDLIIDLLESVELSKILDDYGIREECTLWLFYHALVWVSDTPVYLGSFFTLHPDFIHENDRMTATPSMIFDVAKDFILRPRKFTDKLSNAIENKNRPADSPFSDIFTHKTKGFGLANQERLKHFP